MHVDVNSMIQIVQSENLSVMVQKGISGVAGKLFIHKAFHLYRRLVTILYFY